jgi:pyruvate dehydrogenase E2 component (dihydrolipoamide acetyltransferase)
MSDFVMPSLGADMESGTVLEWRVHEGDTVHRGDIVAVVDTDKSTIEVEVFDDGVIAELLVAPGEEVPVGAPLARIESAAAVGRATEAPAAVVAAPRAPTAAPVTGPRERRRPQTAPAHARRAAGAAGHVRASPLARRRAVDAGLDIGTLDGSGPDGAVVLADVERARGKVREPAGTPAPADRTAAMRRATGALMARSSREIPHYYLATTIDLAEATAWLAAANARRPVTERLLPGALLLKATAVTARQVPMLNGHWDDGFHPSPDVRLGVAVSLRGGGLVAPAIVDADQLSLDELMAALRDLVARARAGTLRSSDVADPSITVTNLGDQGVDEVHGVIYPPQVALVGFGRIAARPWADRGMLGVRDTVRATLAADHRASDGLLGARFLNVLDRHLQAPEDL